MGLRLTPSPEEPCDNCGEEGTEADVRLLEVDDTAWIAGIALCVQCRIRAEALLRGARKKGPRVGQWGDR